MRSFNCRRSSNRSILEVASAAEFVRDILGHIPRPAFSGIEADDPDWVGILPVQQIADDRLEDGIGGIGFTRAGQAGGRYPGVGCGVERVRKPRRRGPLKCPWPPAGSRDTLIRVC